MAIQLALAMVSIMNSNLLHEECVEHDVQPILDIGISVDSLGVVNILV